MGPARESLGFKAFSHIIPAIRYRKVAGDTATTAIPIPGAEDGDVLLGVTEDAGLGDYLSEATLVDGDLFLSSTDTTAKVLLVVLTDEDGKLT